MAALLASVDATTLRGRTPALAFFTPPGLPKVASNKKTAQPSRNQAADERLARQEEQLKKRKAGLKLLKDLAALARMRRERRATYAQDAEQASPMRAKRAPDVSEAPSQNTARAGTEESSLASVAATMMELSSARLQLALLKRREQIREAVNGARAAPQRSLDSMRARLGGPRAPDEADD